MRCEAPSSSLDPAHCTCFAGANDDHDAAVSFPCPLCLRPGAVLAARIHRSIFLSDSVSPTFLFSPQIGPVTGTRAVYTAIGTNFIVLISKVGAFAMTGSASVLSEVIHSIADLLNQCLLAVGIYQSQKEPDATHP